MSEVESAFSKGEISAAEYGRELRRVSRDARAFTQTTRTQTQIFLAQNPAINLVSRSMSTLASVSRTALTILNAWNLAMLVSQGTSSAMLTAQSELARAQRLVNKLFAEGKTGTIEYSQALEVLGIAQAKLNELESQEFFNKLTQAIITFSAAIFGIQQGIKIFAQLAPLLRGLGIVSLAALAPFALLAIAIAAAALAVAFFLAILGVEPAIEFVESMSGIFGPFSKFMQKIFMIELPKAFEATVAAFMTFRAGMLIIWRSVIKMTEGAINAIIGGLQGFINAFISVINRLISAYNRVAKKLGLPKLPKLPGVTLPTVTLPAIAAATGFQGVVNQPTLFLAGEAGKEHVSITPGGGGINSGKGSVTIQINVHGSVISERELSKVVLGTLKQQLKDRGFTGI